MGTYEAAEDFVEFDSEVSARNAGIIEAALDRETQERLDALENQGCTRGIIRLLVDFVPVISQLQKVMQAREEYNAYPPDNKNPEALNLREIALERSMVAVLEGAMDFAVFGGLPVDEFFGTWINRLSLAVRTQKKGEKLPVIGKVIEKVDILGRIARALLKIPEIRNILEKILQFPPSKTP